MKRILPLFAALCCTLSLFAQTNAFRFTSSVVPDAQSVTVNVDQLRDALKGAPREFSGRKSNVTISLPLTDGRFADFTAYDSPVQTSHPEVGSYKVTGPWGGGRVAVSPNRISAVFRGPSGYVIIEQQEDASYRVMSYGELMQELQASQDNLSCGFDDTSLPAYGEMEMDEDFVAAGEVVPGSATHKAGNDPRELRQYDLIITNTGEFAARFGGTRESVVEAYNDITNALNAIFENEIGIRMNLIVIDDLIFLDENTDPYVNANQGGALLSQVRPAFDSARVALNSYDLGHLLTARCTDVGGVVSGRACTNEGKTRGVTCVGGSLLGGALRIMAHEIAHQFAVSHSWNNCPGSEGQRASNTSFEPGSGTTIMSYAGACGNQNIGQEQAYYHVGSVEQFLTYTQVTGARACATVIETDNFTPEADFDYVDGFYIPVSTPFRLEGTATDANDDSADLTYNWDQMDLGPSSPILEPRGNAPLMRSVFPTAEGNVRYFPNLPQIVAGNTATRAERLPTYSRDLTFRLVVRDNNEEAGGIDWEELSFFAEETAGPFLVNDPADEWAVGDFREVTWDVANTDKAPVNCQRVNIVLSTDGGQTFDVVLAENVINNGSAFVTIPEGSNTEEARIMVEAADNVFLNVNSTDFLIVDATEPGFTLDAGIRYEQVCLPYTFETELTSTSVLGYDSTVTLSVTAADLPATADLRLSSDVLEPGETVTLTADLTDVRVSGLVELIVTAVGPGLDTARRRIFLDITDTDFADLATMSPAEGTTGIILATEFDWTDAANADNYEIEIATSPTFAENTIFERRTGLNGSEYLPDEFFAPNTVYFWRVRPVNLCGEGAWTAPNSFRTVNSACTTYENDDAVPLPGTGAAFVRTSTIFVEEAGSISDLNIPNLLVNYSFVSNVKLTLISPAGTRVILYDERCFSTNTINMGFDDDAPLPVVCPPDDRRVFTPVERLDVFVGEDTFGEWILEAAVSSTGGSAGSISSWDIEFCADILATPPQALNNATTEVPPLGRNSIIKDNLRVTSEAFDTDEIKFTITDLPESGDLLLYGRTLMVGDTFYQSDINGIGLFYENTAEGVEQDDFGFLVTTPDGGYLPIAYHDISIFEGAVVSNREVSAIDAGLDVFPNPTAGDLSLRWTTVVNRPLDVQLFDLTGRLLRSRTVNGAAKAAALDVSDLSSGVYLLRIDGAVRRVVKQ